MRLIVFLALGAFAPGITLADDCAPVIASYAKLGEQTAVHQVAEMADGSTLEMVAVGDDLFLSSPAGWQKVPGGGAERRRMMAETISTDSAPTGCRVAGSETIDGVETTQYTYMPPSLDGQPPSEQRVWIADQNGLPFRMRVSAEEQVMTMTFRYDGVTAPE